MKLPVLAALGLMTAASGASAAGLCNCCGAETAQSCAAVCQTVEAAPGQCVPAVDFAAKTVISKDANPLYDVPLRSLWLTTTDTGELEAFRRLLEAARRGLEKDRRAAERAYGGGKTDRAALNASLARYEAAVVNYYLGLRAYRDAYRSR
jgi:hypothetical protein